MTPVLLFQTGLQPVRTSLYDYQPSFDGDILLLSPAAFSWNCPPPDLRDGLLRKTIELCTGMGGMGIGIEYLGGIVCASVEWNELAVRHLERNTNGLVFQLDLNEIDTVKTCPSVMP